MHSKGCKGHCAAPQWEPATNCCRLVMMLLTLGSRFAAAGTENMAVTTTTTLLSALARG